MVNPHVRPMPPDFPEMRKKHTLKYLQKHYKAGARALLRWNKEVNGEPKRAIQIKRIMPDDFSEVAPSMTKAEMIKHWKTSPDVVNRWISESGVTPKKYKPKVFRFSGWKSDIPKPKRDNEVDLAVEYLRKYMAVSRCSKHGKYEQAGNFYRAGAAILTPAQIVEKADAHRQRAMNKIFAKRRA